MSNEFKWDFITETEELLNEVEGDIIDMEYSGDIEIVNRVFRAFHTIRGNAAMLEYERTSMLADYGEVLTGMVRAGELLPTRELVNLLLKIRDYLIMLMGDIRVGRSKCSCDIEYLYTKLKSFEKIAGGKESFVREQLAGSWQERKMRKLRTLIVEDDFVSRRILSTLLAKFGDVDVAVNGEEAVNIFTKTRKGEYEWSYDLICMDIMMPDKNGLDASKEIRQIEQNMKVDLKDEVFIIMITALNDPSTVIKSLYKCGANAFLTKPIDGDLLIRELINGDLIDGKPVK